MKKIISSAVFAMSMYKDKAIALIEGHSEVIQEHTAKDPIPYQTFRSMLDDLLSNSLDR